jgi:hypothetical protein
VGRYPSFPTEWPLGINKEGNRAVGHLSTSLSNLITSLVYSRVTYLVGGLIIIWIIGRVAGRTEGRSAKPPDMFESRFLPFSLLSLSIIFTLVILFDPWEYTSGSGRLAIPLIAQGFVWAVLLFARTNSYPAPAKIVARSVLAAALVLSMNLNVGTWLPKSGNPAEKSIAEISGIVTAAGGNKRANVCMLIDDSWEALTRFAGPLSMRPGLLRRTKTSPPEPATWSSGRRIPMRLFPAVSTQSSGIMNLAGESMSRDRTLCFKERAANTDYSPKLVGRVNYQ